MDPFTDDEIGADFVNVLAGPPILGGDPEAYDALPRREAKAGAFAIGRPPAVLAR